MTALWIICGVAAWLVLATVASLAIASVIRNADRRQAEHDERTRT